jgi:hypothetical protein
MFPHGWAVGQRAVVYSSLGLWVKIAAIAKVYYNSDLSTFFRIHKNSLTVSGSRITEDFP